MVFALLVGGGALEKWFHEAWEGTHGNGEDDDA